MVDGLVRDGSLLPEDPAARKSRHGLPGTGNGRGGTHLNAEERAGPMS